jgi:hypothetical protein
MFRSQHFLISTLSLRLRGSVRLKMAQEDEPVDYGAVPPQMLDPGAFLTLYAMEQGPDSSFTAFHVTTSVMGMDGDPIPLEGILRCERLRLQNLADAPASRITGPSARPISWMRVFA